MRCACRFDYGRWTGEPRKPNPVPASRPVAVIPLVAPLPARSSSLPGSGAAAGSRRRRQRDGQPGCHSPIWPCSAWGLPCPPPSPGGRCALTAPFHPCRTPPGCPAVCSLLHFPSRRHASPLASMLPVGVRTFLPTPAGRSRAACGDHLGLSGPPRMITARSRARFPRRQRSQPLRSLIGCSAPSRSRPAFASG